MFIISILFYSAVALYSNSNDEFLIEQSFEKIGNDGIVNFDISVLNTSYANFPYELVYYWAPGTISAIDFKKSELIATYVDSDGHETKTRVGFEKVPMSFNALKSEIPSKTENGTLTKISAKVLIPGISGPDAGSLVTIEPVTKYYDFGLFIFEISPYRPIWFSSPAHFQTQSLVFMLFKTKGDYFISQIYLNPNFENSIK